MFTSLLLVMALPEENAGDRLGQLGHEVLYTGVGKINATLKLTEALLKRSREGLLVLNVGSAGSHRYEAGEVVCATRFHERDMDATALGFLPGQTPYEEHVYLSNGLPLPGLPVTTCYTGDSFLTKKDPDSIYEVIDMEAYALARTCAYFDMPFAALKFITDGANGQAATDWRQSLALAAEKLTEQLNLLQRNLLAGKPSK